MSITNIINSNGKGVANQYKIATSKGTYFKSYKSVICFVPNFIDGRKLPILGKDWNYSNTTFKHLKTFLNDMLRGRQFGEVIIQPSMSKKDIQQLVDKGGFRYIKGLTLETDTTPPSVNFKRVNNDVNGNPRYVCHFLNFANDYANALSIAKEYGGKKFHNKQYGGGIVFQEYNIDDLEQKILNI